MVQSQALLLPTHSLVSTHPGRAARASRTTLRWRQRKTVVGALRRPRHGSRSQNRTGTPTVRNNSINLQSHGNPSSPANLAGLRAASATYRGSLATAAIVDERRIRGMRSQERPASATRGKKATEGEVEVEPLGRGATGGGGLGAEKCLSLQLDRTSRGPQRGPGAMADAGPKPEHVRSIEFLLKSMGVADYDPRVVQQLLDFQAGACAPPAPA